MTNTPDQRTTPEPVIDPETANAPTETQPSPNLSTEHQEGGDARKPGDKLDRGHDATDDGGRKSSLTHND